MTISRLQDRCPTCNKVAKERFTVNATDTADNDVQLVTLECWHIIQHVAKRGTPFHEFITFEHKNNGCDHIWDKNHCTSCGAFKLYDFQVAGAQFLEKGLSLNKGAGLFDEMGLGKTVQPLAYLSYHPEAFPVLFIVKSGIMFQFFKEIIRWLGPDYLAQIIKTGKDPFLPGLKCYVISYDMLRRFDREKILGAGIRTIILDECQQIKNPDSARTQEVRELVKKVENVIPLSGTPWKNRGSEFFTVLNMLSPMKFPSYQGFLDRWVDFYQTGNGYKEGGIRNPAKFKEYISDLAIRRERTEVMAELPLINRTLQFTELDKVAQITYDNEVSEFVKFFNDKVIGGDENDFETHNNILAKLARMRHITGLAKIPATVDFVKNHITETGRKIVVFVHHKDVGSILRDEFRKAFSDIPVMTITGNMRPEERFDAQEKFNSYDVCILVASTLAAGEGLNLQTCSDCVIHERQWNPANEEQAEGRFIRIGQQAKNVNGTYTTAAGTVDEILASLVEEKRAMFHAAMNHGAAPQWNEADTIRELAERIVNDASKLQKMASFG